MPVFRYTAVDPQGRTVQQEQEADDKLSLSVRLQQRGMFLLGASVLRESEKPARPGRASFTFESIPLRRILYFTDQLALMLRASLPTLEAMECLTMQERHPKFRKVLDSVLAQLKLGVYLSTAFSRHPEAFDSIYINLLAAGEASGRVPEMLDRVRYYLTFKAELRQKVRAALTYPVIVLTASLFAILFLMTFVLPSFVELFHQFDAPVPLATQLLLSASAFLTAYWHAILACLAAAALAFRTWRSRPENREAFEMFLLRLPVVGAAVNAIVLSRVLRTFAVLVESGVPIIRSLELVKIAANHPYYEKLMDQVIEHAIEGKGLSTAFYKAEHFPKAVADIIATAERTGKLGEVLKISAEHYQKELDAAIHQTFAALEPIFVGVLGFVVAGIAACVFYPIISMTLAVG